MLTDAHREDLLVRSGLSIETVLTHEIHSGSAAEVEAVLGFGVGPGLIMPYPGCGGYARVKLDRPKDLAHRYFSPKGKPNHLSSRSTWTRSSSPTRASRSISPRARRSA